MKFSRAIDRLAHGLDISKVADDGLVFAEGLWLNCKNGHPRRYFHSTSGFSEIERFMEDSDIDRDYPKRFCGWIPDALNGSS